ncbi:MAG: FKBP-type peptidyl-prolyl cis-trans isomerase [DPANN group archaeon]|nr:FKBP-type peptidyl-prolyl cis-trans isomerase [DPANN group archaeon]
MAEKKSTTKKTSGVKATAPRRTRPATSKTTTATKKAALKAKKPVSKTVSTAKTNTSRTKRPAVKKTVAKKTTSPATKRPVAKKADTKKQKKTEKKNIFNRLNKFALLFVALVIVVLLVLTATGSNFGDYNLNSMSNSEPSIMVETGDTVSVNYIGSFTDGEVFDTSYEQVAKDNELYQEGRPYTPLVFWVGAGQMIKGFDAAVLNMTIGETKTVTLAPEDAYGAADPARIVEMPTSIDRIITLERAFEISRDDFNQVFTEDPIVDNVVGSDSFPWNFSIKDVSDDNITIEYMLDVGDTVVLPQTIWNSTVTSKNDTTITLIQNPKNGESIQTIFGTGIITLTDDKINIGFAVTAGQKVSTPYGEGTIVDVTDKSVTLDLNSGMVGKTLVFEITVVNITKADVGQSEITIFD